MPSRLSPSRVFRLCRRPAAGLFLVTAACGLLVWETEAFQGDGESAKSTEQEVIVRREALQVVDPQAYRVPLSLAPVKSVDLIAPVDGVIRVSSIKTGQKVRDKSEAFRLDDSKAVLVLKRAGALARAAQIEKKSAQGKNDPDVLGLAEARLEAAEAELELAQLMADQLIVRTPFAGEIERVHVTDGQFVRAGEPLARLIDAAQLTVEVPVDRSTANVGANVELLVEGVSVQGQVEAVVALDQRFNAVRDLVASPVLGLVVIDNSGGKLRPGQTVHSPLLPQEAVTQVPAAAVMNVPDGRRKVQILRDNVVRDLTVRVLGRAGGDYVFVSGRFGTSDEVIVATTRALADGTPLRALVGGGTKAAAKSSGGTKKPASTNSGF